MSNFWLKEPVVDESMCCLKGRFDFSNERHNCLSTGWGEGGAYHFSVRDITCMRVTSKISKIAVTWENFAVKAVCGT